MQILQQFCVILSSVIIAGFVCILLIYNTIKVQQFPQITKFYDGFLSRTRVIMENLRHWRTVGMENAHRLLV